MTPDDVLSQTEDYMSFAEYLADFDGKNWDAETLNKIMGYDELQTVLGESGVAGLKQYLNEYLATSENTLNQAYQNIFAKNEELSKKVIAENDEIVNELKNDYDIDLTNFSTLKEAETVINAYTASLLSGDYDTWLDAMAKIYDKNIDQFETMSAYIISINSELVDKLGTTASNAVIGQANRYYNEMVNAAQRGSREAQDFIDEWSQKGGAYGYQNALLMEEDQKQTTQQMLDNIQNRMQQLMDAFPEFTTSVGSAGSSSGSGDEFTYDDLLDALESLIDKEWEAMQVFDELTGKVTGETAYFTKMENLLDKKIAYYKAQAASALESGDQATYYDYQAKLIQAEVDLANLDDERIQDEIDLAEAKGYSLDAMIKLYQELVKTADTEEDRVEYQNELNDAIREEYEERQRIREFEQDMLETALDRQRGTAWSDSGTYDTLLNAQMKSYKTDASEALTEMERLTQQWIGVYMEQGKSFEEAKELAGQTQDVQDATKEYLDAIEKQADLVVTNVTDKLNEIEQRISDLEASKPQEWSSIDQIKEFSEQTIAMLEAKIPEIKKGLEDVSMLTDEQIQELVDQLNDASTALMEAQINMREEIQSYQESQFSAVEWFVEGIIDDLNDEIEKLDDAYEPILEDLENANDERERAIELEDLLQQKLNTSKEKERVKIVCSL